MRDVGYVGPDPSWRTLYAVGAGCALVFSIMCVVPIALVFGAPPVPETGTAVLGYVAAHRTVYLIEYTCFVGLSLPAVVVFLATAVSLKDVDKGLAAIGGAIGIGSEFTALSLNGSPQSLHGGLWHLSGEYLAASEAQRSALAAAAEALIASANGLNLVGFATALGILLVSLVMLKGVFGKFTAILGIATGLVGMVFEPLRSLVGNAYAVYGTLLLVWFVAVGRGLFMMSRASAAPA